MFAGIPVSRTTVVTVGAADPQRLGPATPNPGDITGEYGATIVTSTGTVGYARLAIDYQVHQYTLKAVTDASCSPVLIRGQRSVTLQLGTSVVCELGGRTLTTTIACCDTGYTAYASIQ